MNPQAPTLLTNGTGVTLDAHCKRAWDFWRSIQSPRTVRSYESLRFTINI